MLMYHILNKKWHRLGVPKGVKWLRLALDTHFILLELHESNAGEHLEDLEIA